MKTRIFFSSVLLLALAPALAMAQVSPVPCESERPELSADPSTLDLAKLQLDSRDQEIEKLMEQIFGAKLESYDEIKSQLSPAIRQIEKTQTVFAKVMQVYAAELKDTSEAIDTLSQKNPLSAEDEVLLGQLEALQSMQELKMKTLQEDIDSNVDTLSKIKQIDEYMSVERPLLKQQIKTLCQRPGSQA